jgi:hypothetical protein
MIASPNKLLPAAELRRLRTGSHESWIEEVRGVVRALLGGDQFEVVSTRADGAVIYTDGKFLRLELQESGPVLSDLDVELFDSASSYGFAQREAEAVADLFLRGAVRKAVTRLENLVPVVPSSVDDVAKVESQVNAPRLWKRQFRSREDHIIRFLGDRADGLEEARLRQNFGKLYDGSIEEGKLVEHEDHVAEVLGIVLNRLGQIRDEVGTALATVTDTLAESAGTVADTFARFADDLYGDLFALHEATSHAIETVDDTRSRGRLCDTLVAGLHDREVASRFVVVVAERMVEAS